MLQPLCPVCALPLNSDWRCPNGHVFDVARQGYVNLLTVDQKHSLHPGDTRNMVAARRRFLSGGYYAPISEMLCSLFSEFAPHAQIVLDSGCGEGYYLSRLTQIPERWGIDISKEATRFASALDKHSHYLTASAAHLPFADASFDAVVCLFALTADAEFARVLKPGGIFIQAVTGQDHLRSLRSVIYPELREKDKSVAPALAGLLHLHTRLLEFDFSLSDAQSVADLLAMTPHFWRISRRGALAAQALEQLDDHAQVRFHIYTVDKSPNL